MRCLSRGHTRRWPPLGWEGREAHPCSFVPHCNMAWQVYCFVPSLNGWQLPPIRPCQRKFITWRERFVRMIEGLCPGHAAEWEKYSILNIMNTASVADSMRQCVLNTFMYFNVLIFQIKVFKCSFRKVSNLDTAERNRTGWTDFELGRNKWRTCSKH